VGALGCVGLGIDDVRGLYAYYQHTMVINVMQYMKV
jgi:hypothetical protein